MKKQMVTVACVDVGYIQLVRVYKDRAAAIKDLAPTCRSDQAKGGGEPFPEDMPDATVVRRYFNRKDRERKLELLRLPVKG